MSDDHSDLYYQHSGRFGLAIPLLMLIGLPAVIALSAVYSYIVVYCPIVGYVNVLFLMGYVLIGGVVLGKLGTVSKCRSEGLLFLLGLILGLAGLYFAWVFFLKALFGAKVSALAVAMHPARSLESGYGNQRRGVVGSQRSRPVGPGWHRSCHYRRRSDTDYRCEHLAGSLLRRLWHVVQAFRHDLSETVRRDVDGERRTTIGSSRAAGSGTYRSD